jgi:hypothetical protein
MLEEKIVSVFLRQVRFGRKTLTVAGRTMDPQVILQAPADPAACEERIEIDGDRTGD